MTIQARIRKNFEKQHFFHSHALSHHNLQSSIAIIPSNVELARQ